MPESVPVRCPACRREQVYAPPSYPCVCGSPVAPPLDRRAVPTAVTHRAWDEEWVSVRCEACGRRDQWPRPELGCSCGTVLLIPVARAHPDTGYGGGPDSAYGGGPDTSSDSGDGPRTGSGLGGGPDTGSGSGGGPNTGSGGGPDTGSRSDGDPNTGSDGGTTGSGGGPDTGSDGDPPRPGAPTPPSPLPPPSSPPPSSVRPPPPPRSRPAFQPVTIRTARDAVTAAALYLRWLGHRDVRPAGRRPPSGVGLAADDLLARVEPTVRPASLRDVECLWLTAMTESADCVYFSLAGYTTDARARADGLGVPLFVLDLTGAPRPVNAPAAELDATAPREPGGAQGS
ncbi:hypothetical protein OG985_12510 [Streptomyces sp. NBC_00289]|uniref:hypothetical protein n=1 Tax=Streptomyces sp. NBC_00289 TaxID=2975703 RepID=UPI00324D48B6